MHVIHIITTIICVAGLAVLFIGSILFMCNVVFSQYTDEERGKSLHPPPDHRRDPKSLRKTSRP
jgi:hypothetical protein